MFEIKEHWEMMALHRALMEARFSEESEDKDIVGSPILARLSERLVEALAASEVARGESTAVEKWNRWRRSPKSGRFWSVAVRAVAQLADWDKLSHSERIALAQDSLAPFMVGEAEVENFILEVAAERSWIRDD